MKCYNRSVSVGDTVELGDVHSVQITDSNVLRAVTTDEDTDEYVILKEKLQDCETIDVPNESIILGTSDGRGMIAPSVFYAIPTEAYK